MEHDPKIFRTIVFIRHGQYKKDPEVLTAIGRKQAQLTAKLVAQLRPTKIYSSTMPRAIETAHHISDNLKMLVTKKDFFREGILPGLKNLDRNQKKKARHNKLKADEAFRYIFKKPSVGQDTEVVVAHGNVIRYWVCKALKINEGKWLNMDIIQASLTTIKIDSKGKMLLLGFSDCGHLPVKIRTYI